MRMPLSSRAACTRPLTRCGWLGGWRCGRRGGSVRGAARAARTSRPTWWATAPSNGQDTVGFLAPRRAGVRCAPPPWPSAAARRPPARARRPLDRLGGRGGGSAARRPGLGAVGGPPRRRGRAGAPTHTVPAGGGRTHQPRRRGRAHGDPVCPRVVAACGAPVRRAGGGFGRRRHAGAGGRRGRVRPAPAAKGAARRRRQPVGGPRRRVRRRPTARLAWRHRGPTGWWRAAATPRRPRPRRRRARPSRRGRRLPRQRASPVGAPTAARRGWRWTPRRAAHTHAAAATGSGPTCQRWEKDPR